jgi:hypothetical protein
VVEQFPRAVYQGAQAWALAEDHRADEARAILARLREPQAFAGVPRDHHYPLALCMLSRACYRLEEATMAGELYHLLLPFRSTTINGQTTWIGPASHDLGLLGTVLGRFDEADGHFADAVERQDRMGARGTVVHTRVAWATMLQRRDRPGDRHKARTLLEQAKGGAVDVNIHRVEALIDRALAALPNATSESE